MGTIKRYFLMLQKRGTYSLTQRRDADYAAPTFLMTLVPDRTHAAILNLVVESQYMHSIALSMSDVN